MRIFIWATGNDTGGQGARIAEAFAKHTDWQVDSLAALNPLGYPQQHDIPLMRQKQWAREHYKAADVVHLRNNLAGYEQADRGQGKPIVLHHHGSMFRKGHGRLAFQARRIGAVQIASTIDLAMLEPGVVWVPAPYDLEALAKIRDFQYVPDEYIKIAHFPTAAPIKDTRAFMQAVSNLTKKYPIALISNVKLGSFNRHPDLVRLQWPVVVRMKAMADIYYDQVQLGYGNNAVEAWAMGIPVVAGVSDPNVRAEMTARWGTIPWIDATPSTIEAALEQLILSEQMRQEWGQRGLEHVQRWHSEAYAVELLSTVYRMAYDHRMGQVA